MKVFLRTFGCRANQYDSEVVRSMVVQAGGEIVSDPSSADFAVFNSCAVTGAAVADLRQAVRRAARENPRLRSLVMGCASGLELRQVPGRSGAPVRQVTKAGAATSLRELPTVEAIVDGADHIAIAESLGLPPLAAPPSSQSGTRALLRIQDGCDEHCTFCGTTIARGPSRSRAVDEIVDEARRLAGSHPEIVVTGVHIGAYGSDTGCSLGALLERLVTAVPGVRYRLSSVEATEVDARLFDLLTAGDDRVAPHLHAPLQSGSDRLLRLMGRHWYSTSSYARVIERIAAHTAHLGLGADVIAGFPGETVDDHRATLRLVEELPFTYLHVFQYSPRPGAAAGRLPAQVEPAVRASRAEELRSAGAAKAAKHVASRDGGSASIVVMRGNAGAREALTEDYLRCTVRDLRVKGGVRVHATLELSGGELVAHPIDRV